MNEKVNQLDRRAFLAGASAATMVTIAGCTSDGDESDGGDGDGGGDGDSGDDFPEDDLEMIIPYSTGGGFDWYGRLVANHMQEELPVSVAVNNVEGAGGDVANQQVYDAEPDGYTFQIFYPQSASRSKIIDSDLEFEVTDYTFFPQVTTSIGLLNLASHVDFDSFDAFVEAFQNDELRLASTGPTGSGAFYMWSLGELSGLWGYEKVLDNTVHVEGTGEMIPLAQREDIEIVGATYEGLVEYYEDGILSPFLELREGEPTHDVISDALTLDDLDIDNKAQIQAANEASRGFAGPPGIPQDRVDSLSEAMTTAIQSDALQSEANDAGRIISYATAEEYAETVQNAHDAMQELEGVLTEIGSN